MRNFIAAVLVAVSTFGIVTVVTAPPAQATAGVCTVTAGTPRVINETIMFGAAQQLCSGDFGRQCVKVRIQQREGTYTIVGGERIWKYRWYTKRTSDWDCDSGYRTWNSTGRVCDTNSWTKWRVKAEGIMLWGTLRGFDWSYVQTLPCRVVYY